MIGQSIVGGVLVGKMVNQIGLSYEMSREWEDYIGVLHATSIRLREQLDKLVWVVNKDRGIYKVKFSYKVACQPQEAWKWNFIWKF